ncbi:N-acetylglucosamine-6-phosphate deacetylase [Mucilaginibacter limnophilus]|uniref:N-acetylglucosamine-6-phosphate deacetylase n=1 Tax=Mucilaginibacter limnophilus TaxID=1932778 RepID=A0A437MVY1_9SPHI|nr:N-acetylglucosamine-6-phosphate deacetylase [Mucilaginibacter limnophilus]RVU01793.1 N-acetylglucosamine-6-phosphate deacetylase [Mucilaginibacter limnophilus]
MITALYNLQLITCGVIHSGKAILIEGKSIKAVIDEADIPAEAEKINLNGSYLAPGLIDLQIYGAGGKLFSGSPSEDALAQMETSLLTEGTTGFFATVATNSDAIIEAAIDAARSYQLKAKGNFLGLHIEGPYLNTKRKGAHPEKFIKKATLTEVKAWVERGKGIIKMITIAPELQDAEVIDYLHKQNIIISAGHTDASYEQALNFFDERIPAATHLYNAMPQMHHRAPGIIPAIFNKKPFTSIVADGIHVSYPMIALAKHELGNKLFLITDAVTETTEGLYPHKFVQDHYESHGILSGSALTMLKAVKNCVQHVGIELAEAVNMASLYPAELAGFNKKGQIEQGFDADLLIFNDKFTVEGVVLQGEIVKPKRKIN